VGNYFGEKIPVGKVGDYNVNSAPFLEAEENVIGKIDKMLSIKGNTSPRSVHIELGNILLDKCGMARSKEGLTEAIAEIRALREKFWTDLSIPGHADQLNVELERAGRVADHLEFAELMCYDARDREESCGGHFRVEHQTSEGEAERDDINFSHASVWEYTGDGQDPIKHTEELTFDSVKIGVRSYK
jgi:succinate dehydrogenase / fumarate reductase flavoprotein subunit